MRHVAALLACLALAAPAPVAAQAIQNVVLRNSFSPLGAGARGLGMGGAFIAVADDGTAASFNPAGLAQLRRTELAVVGFGSDLESTLSVPRLDGVEQTRSRSRHGAPEFFGLSVPFEAGGRHLTVQLSYQRSVDLFGEGSAEIVNRVPAGEVIRDSGDLAFLGLDPRTPVNLVSVISPDQSGAFHTATASLAVQATSRLMLGVSLNYWVAEWTAQGTATFGIATVPAAGAPSREVFRSDTTFRQAQSFRAFNVNAGFLLRYPRLSLGGVLRLPFGGDYDLAETDRLDTAVFGREAQSFSADTGMKSRLHWPRSAGVGVAVRPFSGLTLAGDYSRSYWSRATLDDVPDGALLTPAADDASPDAVPVFTNRNFFDLLPASQTATADTDQWRIGAEYLISTARVVIPLRAGVFRDESPIADFVTDQARRIDGFTVGTGLNFSHLVLDFAFERRTSDGVVGLRVRGGEAGAAATTEEVVEKRLVASLIYRFGEDDGLKRLLKRLFVGPDDEAPVGE